MGISRRDFLKGLGVAGLGSVLYPLVETIPGLRKAALGSTEKQGSAYQWVRVIDLKKCDGCEGSEAGPVCTNTCRGTYFALEGQEWIKVARVEGAGGGSYWMPFPCMHCENAPCVKVCPVGASYHNENGVVLIDHRRCVGCRLCMAACPYQRRYFNWKQPPVPPQAALAVYSPAYPVPPVKGTVTKCVFCAHYTEAGNLPMCIAACPNGAMYFGDKVRDIITNGREILPLSKTLVENGAYRYKEELGTRPRVYYLPGHGEAAGRRLP